ncbi:hypothetical protein EMIT0196MI5_190038 [Pseudomonas sp. IT-196MI5]
MLAMDVNDNACCLDERVAFKCIASKLAPTQVSLPGVPAPCRPRHPPSRTCSNPWRSVASV